MIVASGPSAGAERETLQRLQERRDIRIIAVNESWRLAPAASVLYGADAVWWRHSKGVPDFHGLKIMGETAGIREYPEILGVRILTGMRGLEHKPGHVGNGGNSGFHAVNLAVQFGASRIILVGFDYSISRGVHWHGRHPGRLNNPNGYNVEKWRDRLDAIADDLAALKIEVINASATSALRRFEKRPLLEAIG